MDEMGLVNLFEHHFPSHLTGRIKPDREAFEQVTETLGVDPPDVLFLDDNKENVAAARTCGFAAFQVQGIAMAESVLSDKDLIA